MSWDLREQKPVAHPTRRRELNRLSTSQRPPDKIGPRISFRYLCARRIFNDLFAEMIERQRFAVNELTPRRSIGSSCLKRKAKPPVAPARESEGLIYAPSAIQAVVDSPRLFLKHRYREGKGRPLPWLRFHADFPSMSIRD